jgi:hypothetical protein
MPKKESMKNGAKSSVNESASILTNKKNKKKQKKNKTRNKKNKNKRFLSFTVQTAEPTFRPHHPVHHRHLLQMLALAFRRTERRPKEWGSKEKTVRQRKSVCYSPPKLFQMAKT